LKLQCDEPLSKFAFNFNVRRHIEGNVRFFAGVQVDVTVYKVGWCRLPVSKPELKARLVSAISA
jgi:hypothetical protein